MSNIDWSKLITNAMKVAAIAESERVENEAKELEWRASQLPIAQQNVTAIQFGDEDLPGTEQQWKDYWLALRKWNSTNPDFPNSTKRPVAPA